MKIHTADQLNDKLSEDLSWRKKELTSFRRHVETATAKRESALLRSGVALLYAHWEGYVKNAGTYYLNFVANQGLCYGELSANFFGLAVKTRLDAAAHTRKAKLYTEIAHVFRHRLNHRAKLGDQAVDTKSNLTAELFYDILCLLGLDETPYLGKEKPIIQRVLKLRNSIAHGKWVEVTPDEYRMLHQEIIGLLNHFSNDIENAVLTNAFRNATSSHSTSS